MNTLNSVMSGQSRLNLWPCLWNLELLIANSLSFKVFNRLYFQVEDVANNFSGTLQAANEAHGKGLSDPKMQQLLRKGPDDGRPAVCSHEESTHAAALMQRHLHSLIEL